MLHRRQNQRQNGYTHTWRRYYTWQKILHLVGLSDTVSKAIHLWNLVIAQGYVIGPAVVYQDNMSCMMALIKQGEPGSERSWHINIRHFRLSEKVTLKEVVLIHLGTRSFGIELCIAVLSVRQLPFCDCSPTLEDRSFSINKLPLIQSSWCDKSRKRSKRTQPPSSELIDRSLRRRHILWIYYRGLRKHHYEHFYHATTPIHTFVKEYLRLTRLTSGLDHQNIQDQVSQLHS
jgi:hypothetical protein